MAQNKCDTVFRSDSLQRVLTGYYDRHGTPNEQMWAHYLLGRAYHDMGEAPLAQKAFWDAAERADTSSADCDYWNLCRVYFQLSDIQHQSMLPEEMLKSLALAQTNAEKAGDTISYIMAIGERATAYELLDNADSIIHYAGEASRLFLHHGPKALSCQYLSVAIPPLVRKGDIARAAEYISLYEKYSGYFDSNGNIQEGREIYYHTKGMYYLESQKPDSAELMFRKLLSLAKNTNDIHAAYSGLSCRYQLSGLADSLAKYAVLSEQYDDSLYLSNYRADLQKNEKLYEYTRYLELIHKYKSLSDKRKNETAILSLLLLLLTLTSVIIHAYIRMRHKTRLLDYKNKLYRLSQLKEDDETDIAEKDREIAELTSQIETLQASNAKEIKDDLDKILSESAIVKTFMDAVNHPNIQPTGEDWRKLDILFNREYPNFRFTLCTKHRLNGMEYRVCQLVRINIPPSLISSLLGFEKSYATTVRRRLCAKVLGKDGNPRQFDKYLHYIPRT
jgi:hypothetical protein